jgi:hypothetical protein
MPRRRTRGSNAIIGLLQPGDVELDHLQHRLHGALGSGAVGTTE